MTSEEALILIEAKRRGFLSARIIIPAHLSWHTPPKKIVIPKGATLKFVEDHLYFELDGEKNFKDTEGKYSWIALVHNSKNGQWAEIVEKVEENLVGRYIKVIRDNLGGYANSYKLGDYLKVLENPTNSLVCHRVECAGTLNLIGKNNRIEKGDVELMPIGWSPSVALVETEEKKQLFVFPVEGVCWQPNSELIQYLRSRPFTNQSDNSYDSRKHKGVAWGKTSFYGVTASSGKPLFHISQLEPFLPSSGPKHVKHYSIFPKEESLPEKVPFSVRNGYRLPDKWCILVNSENRATLEKFYKKRIDEYVNCKEVWGLVSGYYFHYPQWTDRAHSRDSISEGYTEITFEEFQRHVPKLIPAYVKDYPLTPQECFFPEKWCIENKEDNHTMINTFMHEHKDEWYHYRKDWIVYDNHTYFHYPPPVQVCHSHSSPQEGYTLITTQQFIKHVLTHTVNKNPLNNLKSNEDGKSRSNSEHNNYEKSESCKVQRPNLQIRDTGQIRATGLRCPKVQIQIRSGHLPD